jgi:hypothetical protein
MADAVTNATVAPQQRQENDVGGREEENMSVEELLYSTASFHAIVKPGMHFVSMILLSP